MKNTHCGILAFPSLFEGEILLISEKLLRYYIVCRKSRKKIKDSGTSEGQSLIVPKRRAIQGCQRKYINQRKNKWGCSSHCNKLLYNKMIIIYDINIIICVWGYIMKNILSIYQNWKKKRQERKQAEQELLLEELAKMVDERRAELLQREREVNYE